MKERCVRCGQETEYDVNMPVEARRWFVEGAGQLCEECFSHLYGLPAAFVNDGEEKENEDRYKSQNSTG